MPDFSLAKLNEAVASFAVRSVGAATEDLRVRQMREAVDETARVLSVSQEDARKIVAFNTYAQVREAGGSPDAFYDSLPPEAKAVLTLTPNALAFNQKITTIKTVGPPIAIGAGLAAAALGLIAWPVALPLAFTGLFWWLNGLANDWNDVFTHGENYISQQRVEAIKIRDQILDVGVTDFGDFKPEELRTVLEAMQRIGYTEIKNPVTGIKEPLTFDTFTRAIKDTIAILTFGAKTPTKAQVMNALRGLVTGSKGARPAIAVSLPSITEAAAPAPRAPREPVTRISQTKTAKPKLFLGSVFGGAVGDFKQFERKVDDLVSDERDLLDDAQTNLVRWLASLAGRLTYEIQIKNNPTDERGVRKIGTWATVDVYLSSLLGKRLFIDSVLLGPLDPKTYFPETVRTQQIQIEIPKLLTAPELKAAVLPTGGLISVDEQGNIVSGFFGAPAAAQPGIQTAGVAAAAGPAAGAAPAPSTGAPASAAPAFTSAPAPWYQIVDPNVFGETDFLLGPYPSADMADRALLSWQQRNPQVRGKGTTQNPSGYARVVFEPLGGFQVPSPPLKKSYQVFGTNSCLRLRSAPGKSAQALSCFADGTPLEATKEPPNIQGPLDGHQWVEVTGKGLTGWMALTFLK